MRPIAEEVSIRKPVQGESGFAAICSAGGLLIALLLAACIWLIQSGRDPEKAVLLTGILFAAVLGAVALGYFIKAGRHARPTTAALGFLTVVATLLLSAYLFRVSAYVFFPADFLVWSEGDFVNDIIKFSVGYPLYSAQVNNDSFHYVPGAQLLTYFLAWMSGNGGSVAAFRIVQVFYTALAAFVAVLCCRRILRIATPEANQGKSWLWNGFWYASSFLIATNTITNSFVHNLHGDALAQLTAVTAYYVLLRYCESRSLRLLAAMVVLVPAGFMIRQSLLILAGCYGAFIALWDRSWRRLMTFGVSVAALLAITFGLCYAIWGEPFFYWNFYILRKHPVSLLRSLQHLLDAWPYFAAGLLGGVAILQGKNAGVLFGPWLIWLGLLTIETYTSGIAWMLNHMGPGCLLGGIWFLAGMAAIWNRAIESGAREPRDQWIRATALAMTIALFFSGLGVVRIPMLAIPADAYRYVHDIEREFHGQLANRVLLDAGSWVYLQPKVVMGDRAPGIGERGFTETADFSGILARIGAKHYRKILVRGFHERDFVYDYYLWAKSSGIREALLKNYREAGRIPGVAENRYARNWAEDPYYFGEITILEPKANGQGL